MITFSNGLKFSINDSKLKILDADNVGVELFADEVFEITLMLKSIVEKGKSSLKSKTSSGVTVNIDKSKEFTTLVVGGLVLSLSLGQFLSFNYYLNRALIKLSDIVTEGISTIANRREQEPETYKKKLDIDFNKNERASEQNKIVGDRENTEMSQKIDEFKDLVLSFLALGDNEITQDDVDKFQKVSNKLLNKEFVCSVNLLNMYISNFKSMVDSKDVLNESIYLKKNLHTEYTVLEELYNQLVRSTNVSEKVVLISLYWLLTEYIQVNSAMSLLDV
ncbi:MAG: hypothetical protein QXP36_02060 [Conexivisphaerales archaeon]